MPYQPIANLNRRGEKVAPFLSIQNLVGVLALGMPLWLGLLAAPPLVRIGAALIGGVVGYVMTLDFNGLSLVERLYWRGMGGVQGLLVRRTIHPHDLPGTTTEVRIPVIQRSSPIRMLPNGPAHHRRGSRGGSRARVPPSAAPIRADPMTVNDPALHDRTTTLRDRDLPSVEG